MARMSTPQRLVSILVAILVVIAVLVLGLSAGGAGIAEGPSPGSSASADPSAPSLPSTPTPSVVPTGSAPTDAEVMQILADIEEQVIAIRGLPAPDIGPAEIISREELAVELRTLFDEQYPQDERDRDNLTLRALGLLAPDEDVAELQLELLGDQVLGFYDDIERRMVVVSDAGLDVAARITYAHEYTHALQDAAFDLDSLEIDVPGEDDRGLARTALIEGDATVTMLAWMLQNLSQSEILEYFGSVDIPDTTGIPSWMVAQLAFPYEAGLNWTTVLAGGDPTRPDFTELDAAFADPPDSTEQVIDVDKWEPREGPDEIDPVDLAAALGTGWREVDATPIGQATIAIMLEHFGTSPVEAREAAAGWGGDRVVVAAGPDDEFAASWRLSWDTATDATEFITAYESVISTFDFAATVIELPDGDILVVHATTDELVTRTVNAAS